MEIHIASSKIWTLVADSISYRDNRHTKRAFLLPNPSTIARMLHKINLKQIKAIFKQKKSFSKIDCLSNANKSCLPYHLSIAEWDMNDCLSQRH